MSAAPEHANGTDGHLVASPIAYKALADSLRASLVRGEYHSGKRLPTEAELSEQMGLSRQTVRRALQDLVAEGLVYRIRGRGTFATSVSGGNRYLRSFGTVEDLLAYSVDTTVETIQPLRRKADVDAAGRLRLDSDEVMVALIRRAHSDAAFCITRVAFSMDIGTKLQAEGVFSVPGEVTSLTAISVVDRVAANRIAGAHQSVNAARMPSALAGYIDLEPDVPTLRIDRLYYDTRGTPLELAISWFNPDRYSYRVELSRSTANR